jgi:hypothetical protein
MDTQATARLSKAGRDSLYDDPLGLEMERPNWTTSRCWMTTSRR